MRERKKKGGPTPAEIREKKRWNSLRAAEASVGFLNQEGAAQGQVLAGAAPLVFQGMCRREGIKVFFTDTPKTDGRSIWLGPVDLTNPLAAVYVYGHGTHERHHVVYSDFEVLRKLESAPLRELTNVFEDIRIDLLGAADYAGYLLWRSALFKAYVSSGTAPWKCTAQMPTPQLLAMAVLFHLEVSVLGLEELRDDAEHLAAEAERAFGVDCMKAVLAVADECPGTESTADAVRLARRVLSLLGTFGEWAMERFGGFDADLDIEVTSTDAAQSSLFGADGEVNRAAVPRAVLPGYAEAKREARSFASLCVEEAWQGAAEHVDRLRELMTPDSKGGFDQAIGMQSRAFAEREDYAGYHFSDPVKAKKLFYADWQGSGSFRHLFQSALEHPVPRPAVLSSEGLEMDDAALALMIAGEDRIFRKNARLSGRETAFEILLDNSGSMTDPQMALAKTAGLRLLEALRLTKGYRAAMGLFPGATNRSVTPVADWESSVRDTVRRLDFVSGYGCTPILQALFWAASELDARPEEKKVIFVITDGYFPEPEVNTMLDDLAQKGILVAMVGIGRESTPRGDFVAKAHHVSDLPKAMAEVVSRLSRRLRLG